MTGCSPTASSSATARSFGHPDAVRIAVPDADGLDRLDRALTATE